MKISKKQLSKLIEKRIAHFIPLQEGREGLEADSLRKEIKKKLMNFFTRER